MKKNLFFFLCLLTAVFFASCKSTPKEEAPAETAQPETTVKDENASPAAEQAAASAAPAEETAPDYGKQNALLLEKAAYARDMALAADAPSVLSDAFSATEKLYNDLKNKNDGSADLGDQIKDVTARYEALEKCAKALALKKKIDSFTQEQYDLAAYSENDYEYKKMLDSYAAGQSDYDALLQLYADSSSTGQSLLDKAQQMFDSYSFVYTAAVRRLASKEREAAYAEKKLADSVKAGVAQKDPYAKAVEVFKAGDTEFATQNPENAFDKYKDALTRFTSLYTDVSEQRRIAQEAMDRAKQRAAQSSEYALSADESAPLEEGAAVQGIDTSDTPLLEEDTYEDPSASEAYISEDAPEAE